MHKCKVNTSTHLYFYLVWSKVQIYIYIYIGIYKHKHTQIQEYKKWKKEFNSVVFFNTSIMTLVHGQQKSNNKEIGKRKGENPFILSWNGSLT